MTTLRLAAPRRLPAIDAWAAAAWLASAAAWLVIARVHSPLAASAAEASGAAPRFTYFCTLPLHAAGSSSADANLLAFVVPFSVMLVAMMLPTVIPISRYLAASSLRRRRKAVVGLFLAGYFAVWLGCAMVAIGLGLRIASVLGSLGAPRPSPRDWLVATLALAAAWQVSPLKRRLRRASRSPRPFPLNGLRANAICVRAGVSHGLLCVGSCWPLMLLGLGSSLGWMLAAGALIWVERTQIYGWRLAKPSAAVLAAASAAYLLL